MSRSPGFSGGTSPRTYAPPSFQRSPSANQTPSFQHSPSFQRSPSFDRNPSIGNGTPFNGNQSFNGGQSFSRGPSQGMSGQPRSWQHGHGAPQGSGNSGSFSPNFNGQPGGSRVLHMPSNGGTSVNGPTGGTTTFSGPSFSHRHGGPSAGSNGPLGGSMQSGSGSLSNNSGGSGASGGPSSGFAHHSRANMASAVMSHHQHGGNAGAGVQPANFLSRHGGHLANLSGGPGGGPADGTGLPGNLGANSAHRHQHPGGIGGQGGGFPGAGGGTSHLSYRPQTSYSHHHHHGGNQLGHHHHHHPGHHFNHVGLWYSLGLWGSPWGWSSAFYRPWWNYPTWGYSGYGVGYGAAYPWYRYGWNTSGYYPSYQATCSSNPAYYTLATYYQPVLSAAASTDPAAAVVAATPEAAVAATADLSGEGSVSQKPDVGDKADNNATADSEAFAQQGELHFKAGKYADAAYAFRHALVDDPENGVLMLLLSQSLFAQGKFPEAAGATQVALLMLPTDKWGLVVENYAELYSDNQQYTDQLRALEKARKEKPDEPGLRFLLGYHYGYLGYPTQAIKELDKAVELAPKDELAAKLREALEAKANPQVKTPEPPAEPQTPPAADPISAEPAAP